jgi:hypothetical protein
MLYNAIFLSLAALRMVLSSRIRMRDALYPVVLVILFVLSAFRFDVGCDWNNYFLQFEYQLEQPSAITLSGREPVWWLSILAVQGLGLDYVWINVLSSLVFFAGIHALARRQPDRLSFLIVLFPILIINMPMSGIRQGAAIGIICFAFVAFMDRRVLRYTLLVLLASLVHSSAAIFFLLVPLVQGGYSRSRLISAVVLAAPVALMLINSEGAELAFSRYVDTGIDAGGAVFRCALLTLTGILFFGFLNEKWRRAFLRDFKLVNLGSIYMLLNMALLPLSTVIADRLGYYFIPIQAMIFARLPFLPLRGRSFLVASPYLLLAVVFVGWTLMSRHFQFCYVPYRSWLFGI